MEKPQNVDTLIDHVGKREVHLIVGETATRPSFSNALASLRQQYVTMIVFKRCRPIRTSCDKRTTILSECI